VVFVVRPIETEPWCQAIFVCVVSWCAAPAAAATTTTTTTDYDERDWTYLEVKYSRRK
jgi:hypothetical protein